MDNMMEFMFEKLEIPTKVKTAFTREYNKIHPDKKGGSKKVIKEDEEDLEEEEELEEKELDIEL
jgi:hypothetical protein